MAAAAPGSLPIKKIPGHYLSGMWYAAESYCFGKWRFQNQFQSSSGHYPITCFFSVRNIAPDIQV